MTQMEIRSVEIREVDEEKRTVSGLAVPYNQETSVGGYTELFERGAIDSVEDTKLFWNHDEPIGRVIRGEDTDEGFLIEAVISKTARGDEAYTLVKDGVINKFSVGFLPLKHRMEKETVVRTKVELKEVSLVPFPAYKGASLLSVREEETETAEDTANNSNEKEVIELTDNTIAPETAELREAVDVLERKVNALSVREEEGNKVIKRSGGEFLKALAAGDEEARNEIRAFTGATSVEADITRPGWVNERMRLALENRPLINAFGRAALPASGNTIEYPVIDSVTGTVEEQENEGDDLAYMEVALDTATASVKTFGGYSSLSRQSIERSDLAYLQTVLEYQVRQYAKATEAYVRGLLVAATGTGTGTLATDDAVGWIDVVVDAAAEIYDNTGGNASADFAVAGRDVFKRLAGMTDDNGRPLFAIAGQSVNSLGSANLLTPSLNVGGLTVVVNPAFADDTFIVASADAVKTWESPGAPFRLQDENIINLTKDFSLYGYLAAGVLDPNGIVKVDVDLTP